MISLKRAGIAGAIASAVALIGAVLPAQAATPTWHQVFSNHYGPASDNSSITAVFPFATNNVWALGGTDLNPGAGTTQQVVAVQWNGSRWSGNQAPAGVKSYITAVGASSASNIWAGTFSGGYVLHYDGSHWKVAKQLPGGGLVSGVTVISPTNVWVFGNGGGLGVPGVGTWHYLNGTWKQSTGTYTFISGASAASATDIWGVASVNGPADTIVRFDGSAWKPVTGIPGGLTNFGVTALRANNVWVIGQKSIANENSYLVNYSGHWSRVVQVPWGLQVQSGLTPDGKGGLWFSARAPGNPQWYEVHWIPGTDKWFRNAVPGAGRLIPGTASWVAGGRTLTATGSNAVVWAYGSI